MIFGFDLLLIRYLVDFGEFGCLVLLLGWTFLRVFDGF